MKGSQSVYREIFSKLSLIDIVNLNMLLLFLTAKGQDEIDTSVLFLSIYAL